MNRLHDLVKPVLRFDQLAPASTQLGEASQKRLVDRAVDSQGKHANAAQLRRERMEDLVLVAHLAVGNQHEDCVAPELLPSRQFLRIRSLADQPPGRLQKRFGHLGPAPSIDPGQVLQGGETIPVGRGDKVRGQAGRSFHDVIEREHGEPVRSRQRVDHPRHAPGGRHDLPAFHAAGAVEHEHDIARPAGELGPLRRD